MFRLKHALLAGTAFTIAATAAPMTASAQLVDEVIVVTAQKREESILEVPMAISAVTGDFLESAGIKDVDDLSDYVAGLTIQLQNITSPSIVIRGISSDSSEPNRTTRTCDVASSCLSRRHTSDPCTSGSSAAMTATLGV